MVDFNLNSTQFRVESRKKLKNALFVVLLGGILAGGAVAAYLNFINAADVHSNGLTSSTNNSITYDLRDKFEDFISNREFDKNLSLNLFDSSPLFREIYESNPEIALNILRISHLNGSKIPKNLVYQVLNQIERDYRVFDKVQTAIKTFEILSNLGLTNLKKESIWYVGNLTVYLKENLNELYSIDDFKNTIYLIENSPLIYTGLSGEFTLIGRDTDILTYLVRMDFNSSKEYPYLTWALAKKASLIVDLINRKAYVVVDYQSRPPKRAINFDIRNKYETNHTFLELVSELRNKIVKSYTEDLWLIGLKPEEVVNNMNGSKIKADIAMLHVVFPYSLINSDSLHCNWLYVIYPDKLYSNPEWVILTALSNNLKAMDIFKKMYKDYEAGYLFVINPYTGKILDIDSLKLLQYQHLKRFNAESARDLEILYKEGSRIFRYGEIARTLAVESWFLNKYGIPGIQDAKYEEYRTDLAMTIGASVGVPVYAGDYKTADGYHGLAFPIILESDYQKLMNIDSSPLIYDSLTQAISIYISRVDSNYWILLTGKEYRPYLYEWRLTSFPIPYKYAEDIDHFWIRTVRGY